MDQYLTIYVGELSSSHHKQYEWI